MNYPFRSMPAETLHLHYSSRPRGNRRRPKHPILQAIVRLTLLLVALGIVITIFIKLGFFQEPNEIGGHGILAQCVVAAPSA
jgi:hypothetical protein